MILKTHLKIFRITMEKHIYKTKRSLELESGERLEDLNIAYHVAGQLNETNSNVIWVCHAFSANSDVSEWWPEMVGKGKILDPEKYFIVCANYLGSCYGTTGPLSINPQTNDGYYQEFPEITIRDMVKAHDMLRKYLGIEQIYMIIGGSIGAFQALEWNIMRPELFDNLVFIASNAKASPWNIAFNETQRMAIQADPTFKMKSDMAGIEGMKTARAVALLSYRNYMTYYMTQQDEESLLKNFRACSYQNYQGEKLARRFNAFSYYFISKSFDTHDVGRNRGGVDTALSRVKANSLIIGISSDMLFPVDEQKYVAEKIKEGKYFEIDSEYGHDGFLLEYDQLEKIIFNHLKIVKHENTC